MYIAYSSWSWHVTTLHTQYFVMSSSRSVSFISFMAQVCLPLKHVTYMYGWILWGSWNLSFAPTVKEFHSLRLSQSVRYPWHLVLEFHDPLWNSSSVFFWQLKLLWVASLFGNAEGLRTLDAPASCFRTMHQLSIHRWLAPRPCGWKVHGSV